MVPFELKNILLISSLKMKERKTPTKSKKDEGTDIWTEDLYIIIKGTTNKHAIQNVEIL